MFLSLLEVLRTWLLAGRSMHLLAVLLNDCLNVLLISRSSGLVDRFLQFFIVKQILVSAISSDIAVHVVFLNLLDVVGVDLYPTLTWLVLLPKLNLAKSGGCG